MATVDLTVRFLLLPQLRALCDAGYEVTAISAPGPHVGDIEAQGIRHIPWPHATRAWSPGSDARAFSSLLRIFRRERFDLVHTHNPKPGVLGRIAAGMAGVPCVVNTVHGLYATPDDRLRRKAAVLPLEWMAARFSDLELYQSEEDLRWARRVGVAPRWRSRLLGNGVDVGRFDPRAVPAERVAELRRELGIPEDAPVVGTVGRMVAEKGYRELFAAARSVTERVPEARFVAVGGADPQKWDAIAAEPGSPVQALEWRDDVRDLLAAFDVFVLASWREGVPRSAIEAAAMGKAMVLSDIRGCREVGRHRREALLVPPRDASALARAILELLGDDDLRARLGRAARARARERFDEGRVVRTVIDSYEELFARKGLGRGAAATGAPVVRPASPADAPAMARLHRRGLPDAFLPTLGPAFLVRLYRALAADPAAVVLVAEDDGEVVGFAAGVPSVRAFYRRFLARHGLPAVAAALPHLVRPGVMRRALETASYGGGAEEVPDAELLSIAVDQRLRSRCAGTALVEGILRGLRRRGAGGVKVVVAGDNAAGNRLYERTGFRLAGRITVHRGSPSNLWVHGWPPS